MSDRLTLKLTNDISELSRARKQVDLYCRENKLTDGEVYKVKLVVSELLSNTMCHAYPDGRDGEIKADLKLQGLHLKFEFLDDGDEFDIAAALKTISDETPVEATPGGHGLRLVRSFTQHIHYERDDGANHLTLEMALSSPYPNTN